MTAAASALPEVRPRSRVRFRDLVIREEAGRFILGSRALSTFFAVDADAARVVRLLAQGRTVEDVELRFLLEAGDTYDVAEAVRFLAGEGLVEAVDDVPVPLSPDLEARLRAHASAEAASRRLGWLHSWPGAVAVALAASSVAWLFRIFPEMVPVPGVGLLVVESPFLLLVLGTFLSLVTVSFHEFGHWVVARSYGVDSRIRLTARLYFLVLETDVTKAWRLPRADRAVIFLAGMAANVLLMAVIAWAWAARAWGWWDPPFLGEVAPLLLFFNLFQIVFQFFVFLRTDLYFLFTTATGEWNLHDDVKRFLRGHAARGVRALRRVLTGRSGTAPVLETDDALDHAPHHFAAYTVLLVAGTFTALAFLTYTLPETVRIVGPVVAERYARGVSEGSPLLVAEAAGVVAYFLVVVGLIFNYYVVGVARGFLRWWRETAPL